MTVYVESNFLLEIVLGQPQSGAALNILRLAEAEIVSLIIPSFSLVEPLSTITYRRVERSRLCDNLTDEIRQLSRSSYHGPLMGTIRSAIGGLQSIAQSERSLLEDALARVLAVAGVIEVSSEVFNSALVYIDKFGMKSLQDAIIFASVVRDLRQQPTKRSKCFISTNAKDFDDPGLIGELQGLGCQYFSKFDDALTYLQRP